MRWFCRYCKNVETHDETIVVYSLQMQRELGEGGSALKEIGQFAHDPTVRVTNELTCPNCGWRKVASFVNPIEKPIEDMSLFFACTRCTTAWKSAGTKPANAQV